MTHGGDPEKSERGLFFPATLIEWVTLAALISPVFGTALLLPFFYKIQYVPTLDFSSAATLFLFFISFSMLLLYVAALFLLLGGLISFVHKRLFKGGKCKANPEVDCPLKKLFGWVLWGIGSAFSSWFAWKILGGQSSSTCAMGILGVLFFNLAISYCPTWKILILAMFGIQILIFMLMGIFLVPDILTANHLGNIPHAALVLKNECRPLLEKDGIRVEPDKEPDKKDFIEVPDAAIVLAIGSEILLAPPGTRVSLDQDAAINWAPLNQYSMIILPKEMVIGWRLSLGASPLSGSP